MKITAKSVLLAAALCAGALIPQASQAAVGFGSVAFVGNRLCTDPQANACTIGSPLFRSTTGGVNVATSVSYQNINGLGAFGSAAVTFGSGLLPQLHAATFAGATTRTGSTVSAFRVYTYTGTRAIYLALNGALDFANSGDVPGNDAYGDGQLNVFYDLQPLSALADFNSYSTGADILGSNVPFADCSSGATAFADYQSTGTVNGGTKTANISLSTNCSGNRILVNPGDSFVIAATMQAISNRGGFIDASHTFSIGYDFTNTIYQDSGEAVGMTGLLGSISTAPVPEPGIWMSMIAGFGLVGGLARRQSRKTITA